MNDTTDPPVTPAAAALPPAPAEPVPTKAAATGSPGLAGWILLVLALLAAAVSAWSAVQTQARVRELESELVKRQQASSDLAAEARISSRQAQDVARESAAKMALLEARVAESAVQRSQVEELMQAVARSRDENVLSDIEAALRVAMQQGAITGSADTLLSALKQAEERLARHSQPHLERVRLAVASDLERVKSVAVSDIAALTVRLDEVIRLVDEMPLLSRPQPRPSPSAGESPDVAASAATAGGDSAPWADRWRGYGALVWGELRSLVRVTPIDQPEAMLVAPEQTYFLRENLKLRLLNARLALLSRQYATAQSDLRDVRAALERYFDRDAKVVETAVALVRQVASQARLVIVPRPDATLAAIAAATPAR